MKKEIIIIGLIGVLFLLVVGSIIASLSFYKEYKDKIDYLDQQAQTGKSKIEGIESKVNNFKSTVDEISSQIKTYSDSINNIQNTITLSESERKSLLSKIEEMKKDLQGIQKDYSTTVVDIRQSMMGLKDELEKMAGKSKDIELGKITVKQDEANAAVNKDAPKAADQAPAPVVNKPAGSNFKSANLRKAGSF
jgi:chromosome segregation ATPase